MTTINALQARIAELEARQQQTEHSALLYSVSQALNKARDEDELLSVLIIPAEQAGASQAILMYIDLDEHGEPEYVEVVATWHRPNDVEKFKVGMRFYIPARQSAQIWVQNPDELMYSHDFETDDRYDDDSRAIYRHLGVRALVAIPFTQAGRWIAVMGIYWDDPHDLSLAEAEIYRALMGLGAAVVENRRLFLNLENVVEQRTIELRRSQQRYTDAQRVGNVGIWEYNYITQERYWSELMFPLHGLTPDQPAPEDDEDLLALVLPQDREKFATAIAHTHVKDGTFSVEYRTIGLDGAIQYILSRGTAVVDEADTVVKRVGTAQDITTLKLAEAQISTLYEISRALNVANSEKTLLEALISPALNTGLATANLLYFDLDDHQEPQWAEIAATWANGEISTEAETRFYLPDYPQTDLWLAELNNIQMITNVYTDSSVDEANRQVYAQAGIGALLIVPLAQANRWVGLLVMGWHEPREFPPTESAIYQALPALAGPAVANYRTMQHQTVLQQGLIEAQRRAIEELSTPIIPLMNNIIVLPLIGSIDTMRARDVLRSLLAGISDYKAKVVIIDITGVPVVDSGVAGYLNRAIQAARLKGARTILTGISDSIAESVVDLGIADVWDVQGVETVSNLQTGFVLALRSVGMRLTNE